MAKTLLCSKAEEGVRGEKNSTFLRAGRDFSFPRCMVKVQRGRKCASDDIIISQTQREKEGLKMPSVPLPRTYKRKTAQSSCPFKAPRSQQPATGEWKGEWGKKKETCRRDISPHSPTSHLHFCGRLRRNGSPRPCEGRENKVGGNNKVF